MYRKVVLIFIQVYLVQYGIITQALVVFVLLIFFLILSMTKKPFQTVVLNQLEIISLAVSMFTIFCGIFYIVNISTTDTTTGTTSNSSGGKAQV